VQSRQQLLDRKGYVLIGDPPIAQLLFSSTRLAWLWLVLRVWLGWQWLNSGWGKFTNPAWMDNGTALRTYWERAVAVPEAPARPPITFDWYRDFLNLLLAGNHEVWFAKLITFGELAIGLGLILGAFVGLAAFFGALMNWSFLMAGTTSTNPVLLIVAVALMLAWKVAGYYGLDRYLLPLLGTPWQAVPTTAPVEPEATRHPEASTIAG
jgi:thiosulfate dehydrogenase [quinone] large subunit